MSYLTNCPPCDTNFPILCEPLETTASGKRLVVEDAAACQKTIQTPTGQQILKTDGSGNLGWTNGSNDTVLTKSPTGVIEFATLSMQVPDGSITTAKLADLSVTTPKLANLSVTAAKLGTNEQKQICKAWVSFNGLSSPITINASYNVSSVTKNSTGDYTINFTSQLSDANYSVSGICSSGTNITYTSGSVPYVCGPQATPTTLQFRFGTGTGTVGASAGLRLDQSYIYIQVFGN